VSTLEQKLFGKKKQAQLLTQMRVLLAGGLDSKHVAQSLAKHGGRAQKHIGNDMLTAINQGKPPSHALKKWIHPIAFACLTVGDKTGGFIQSLDSAVIQLKSGGASTGRMMVKLTGGFIFFAFTCLLAQLSSTELFPTLQDGLDPSLWGTETRFAQSVGAFFAQWNLFFLITFIVVGAGVLYSLPTLTGPTRRHLDKMPFYKTISHLYRMIQAASLLRSTGNLVAGGIDIEDAIKHCEPTVNSFTKRHIKAIRQNIRKGKSNLGDMFDTGLLSDTHLNALKIMGSVGQHDIILSNITAIIDAEIDFQIEFASTVIPSALRILGFLLIATLAMGLLSAMFAISTSINSY
jgi:type II secretory pathway component PulF